MTSCVTASILPARTDAHNTGIGLATLAVRRIVRKVVLDIPVRNASVLAADELMQRLAINEQLEGKSVLCGSAV